MSIDTEISMSLANKYAEAVRRCLLLNVPLSQFVEGKGYLQYPDSVDQFSTAPKFLTWPETNLIKLNPKPGDWAWPTISVVIFLILSSKTSPQYKITDPNPMDLLEHCEKVLERGSLSDGGELGKLYDPTLVDPHDVTIPPDLKYLNRERPNFSYKSRRIIAKTQTTAWPLIVTYRTTIKKTERTLI